MNKALGILLFIIAGVAVLGMVSATLFRLKYGFSPEAGVIFAGLLVGGLCIWGGIKMWRKG